jgi:hypothetical protein
VKEFDVIDVEKYGKKDYTNSGTLLVQSWEVTKREPKIPQFKSTDFLKMVTKAKGLDKLDFLGKSGTPSFPLSSLDESHSFSLFRSILHHCQKL